MNYESTIWDIRNRGRFRQIYKELWAHNTKTNPKIRISIVYFNFVSIVTKKKCLPPFFVTWKSKASLYNNVRWETPNFGHEIQNPRVRENQLNPSRIVSEDIEEREDHESPLWYHFRAQWLEIAIKNSKENPRSYKDEERKISGKIYYEPTVFL